MNAIPYSRNALANAPSRKYFIEASCASGFVRSNPAITYSARDSSSTDRNTMIRSVDTDSSVMPVVDSSSSA